MNCVCRLTIFILFVANLILAPPCFSAEDVDNWQRVVRDTPYWESQGVAANLTTIRRWVLFSESYCAIPDRHILLDRQWRFLGYIDNGATPDETTERLNSTRRQMALEERVKVWYPGELDVSGYPFALSCDQPFVEINDAIARLTGVAQDSHIWGSWDGIEVGTEAAPVTLLSLFHEVVDHRRQQGRFTFPDSVLPTFLGKVVIESSVRKNARSTEGALGILQLSLAVLKDCRIPEQFYLHRIVQVDCALSLVEQNHRNLSSPFNAMFGHLPEDKRARLYGLILTQAYLVGVGRSIELLQDEVLGAAARYFAANHSNFSAEDMMIGMIYHNLGRKDLGLRSLYYVIDARLAQSALCGTDNMSGNSWCAR